MLLRRFLVLLACMLCVLACKKPSVVNEPEGGARLMRYRIAEYVTPQRVRLQLTGGAIIAYLRSDLPMISESTNPILFKKIALEHGEDGQPFMSITPSIRMSYGISRIQVFKDGIDVSDRVRIVYPAPKLPFNKRDGFSTVSISRFAHQLTKEDFLWLPLEFLITGETIDGLKVKLTLMDGTVVTS